MASRERSMAPNREASASRLCGGTREANDPLARRVGDWPPDRDPLEDPTGEGSQRGGSSYSGGSTGGGSPRAGGGSRVGDAPSESGCISVPSGDCSGASSGRSEGSGISDDGAFTPRCRSLPHPWGQACTRCPVGNQKEKHRTSPHCAVTHRGKPGPFCGRPSGRSEPSPWTGRRSSLPGDQASACTSTVTGTATSL
jgi:hypothetical protein